MNLMRNREVKIYSLIYWLLSATFVIATLFINFVCSMIVLLMCCLFYGLFLLVLKIRYDKIKNLSLEIDEILYGKKFVKISENKEGELSILENEIEKMLMMLQIQNEELEKERNFLSDSIADISHQLRTPLTSINIILTLLRADNIDKKQSFELLNRLTRLVDRIDNLITTLLKISKIDTGTVKFASKSVSVKQLVEKAFEPLSAMFDIKEQNFCVEVTDEAYIGDISWSVEALSNIIKNCSEHKLNKETTDEAWQLASPTSYNSDLISFSGILEDNLGVLIYGLAALLILIIVAGSVGLIYNSFSISVSERTKQFGILKSIGATKKQLLNSVLFESLALCAVAVPLGLLSGCIGLGVTFKLIQPIFSIAFDVISIDGLKFTLHINFIALLIAAFISIFTTVISAYIPAKKAVKISSIEAIRQSEDIKISSKSLKISPLTYKLFGISGMIASKNFKRNKKKYRVTIMSLFLSIVLFVSASSLCSYFKKGLSYEMSQYSNYDILAFCDFQDNLDKLFDGVKNLNGVESSAFRTQSDITYIEKTVLAQEEKDDALQSDKYENSGVNLAFVDDENFKELLSKYHLNESEYMNFSSPKALLFDEKTVDYRTENGKLRTKKVKTFKKGLENFTFTSIDAPNRIDSEKYGEIWFSGEIKEENGKVYAKYQTFPDEGEEIKEDEFEWIEISICSYNVGKTIDEAPYYITEYTTLIYPLSAYDAVAPKSSRENETSEIFVEAENHKAVSSEISDLIATLGLKNRAFVYDYAATIEMTKAIITIVNVFSYGFIVLISLISVANVFNTITTNIYLRRREFAMLKSIGMTEKGFSKMLTFESLIYGFKSLLLGFPVSMLFCFATYYITYSSGYDIEFYFPVNSFLIAGFSVFAVVFSSVVYSMKKVRKDNTIDALKNENI